MTANTRASATWPDRDETRLEKTTSRTAETPRTLLPAEVRDALHQALLAQPAVGVVVCDAEGSVTTMNERMEEIAGRRPLPVHVDEWPRRYHLHGQASGSPLQPADNPLVIAMSGHAVTDLPVTVERPGSPTRHLRCSAVPLRGPGGKVLGGLALFVDVTTQPALQPGLEDERLLVQTVDHEVRTPLTCIIGHLELLADLAADLRGDARWSWEALVRGAARLQAAVDKLTAQSSCPASRDEPPTGPDSTHPAPLADHAVDPRSDGGLR